MKIILQKSVDKLGDPGDVAEVADGYARNYLIPRGYAIRAEKGALKHAESLARSHKLRVGKQKGEFEALASKLIAGGPLQIAARAGEEGKLFGSSLRRHRRGDLGSPRDGHRQARRPARRADPLGGHPRGQGSAVPRCRADPHRGGHGAGLTGSAGPARCGNPAPCRPRRFRVRCVLHTCPHGYPHGGNAGQRRSDNKLRFPTCGAAIHSRSPLSARDCGA